LDLLIHHQDVPTKTVVRTAISGLAKGKNPAPKRLKYTASIGDPQQPSIKHPAKARNPEKVIPPRAKVFPEIEFFSLYRRNETDAKASERAYEYPSQ